MIAGSSGPAESSSGAGPSTPEAPPGTSSPWRSVAATSRFGCRSVTRSAHRSWSTRAARGLQSASTCANSASRYAPLVGTTTSPNRRQATWATARSTVDGPETSTRSPATSPAADSRPAAATVRSRNSPRVTQRAGPPPTRPQSRGRSGSGVSAAVHAPASVPGSGRGKDPGDLGDRCVRQCWGPSIGRTVPPWWPVGRTGFERLDLD